MIRALLHGSYSTIKFLVSTYVNLALRISFGVFDLTLDLVVGVRLGIANSSSNNYNSRSNWTAITALGFGTADDTFRPVRSIFVFPRISLVRGLIGFPDGDAVFAADVASDARLAVREVDAESVCLAKRGDGPAPFFFSRETVFSAISRVAVPTVGRRRRPPGDHVLLGSLDAFCRAVEVEWRTKRERPPQVLLLPKTDESAEGLPLLRAAAAVPGSVVVDVECVDGVAQVQDALRQGRMSEDAAVRAKAAMIVRFIRTLSHRPDETGDNVPVVHRLVLLLPDQDGPVPAAEAVEAELRRFVPDARKISLDVTPRKRRVVHVQQQWRSSINE